MICAGRKHMIYWDLNCFSNLEFSFIHACYTFFPKAPKMVFAGVCFIEIFFVNFFHFFFVIIMSYYTFPEKYQVYHRYQLNLAVVDTALFQIF